MDSLPQHRRGFRRGASILAVLGLVTVLTFLAAAMTALFLQGLHFSQGSFNGDIALNQAEAGLHEVLYRLGQDETCSYGKAGETIQSSVQHEFPLEESYYRVSFQAGSGAYSTNNIDGDRPNGYLGSSLGTGCVHIVVTGFCRGQYRCLEAVVRKPESAYGIASSGRIHSLTPLQVYGTSTAAQAESEDYRAPGHIACNSELGVQIERPAGTPANLSTDIHGSIQSVGPISVAQPAVVKAGLRPHSSAVQLPRFPIQTDLNPAGEPGTVNIVELTHDSQELDVIYHCSHDLTFTGPINLHDAYLYVRGKLVVHGGITGTGAVVVDGDVEIRGGTALAGSNNLALLSTGQVTLTGSNNYFQGYVYAEKGVSARNLTVVGSLILNHQDGQAEPLLELDHVTVVNAQSEGELKFTAQTYSYADTQASSGAGNYLSFDWEKWGDFMGDDSAGVGTGIPEEELPDKLAFVLTHSQNADDPMMGIADLNSIFVETSSGGSGGPDLAAVQATLRQIEQRKADTLALQEQLSQLSGDDPDTQSRRAEIQAQLDAQVAGNQALWAGYQAQANQFARDYTEYVRRHSNANGARRLRPGAASPDVSRTFELDLNRYLPPADRLHVAFCRVYNRKL